MPAAAGESAPTVVRYLSAATLTVKTQKDLPNRIYAPVLELEHAEVRVATGADGAPAASSSNRGLRTAPARPTAASPPASPATTRFPAASAGELSEAVPTTTRPFSGCSNTNHRWPCPSSGSSPHPAAPRAAWPRPVPTRARARELVVWERTLRRERPRRARHPARRTVTSAEWIQGRSLPARPNRDRRTFAERARRFTRGAGRCATRRAGRSSLHRRRPRARRPGDARTPDGTTSAHGVVEMSNDASSDVALLFFSVSERFVITDLSFAICATGYGTPRHTLTTALRHL